MNCHFRRRTLGLAVLTIALQATTARSQEDKAPQPPRVNPVSPGTSVDGEGAPVKLDAETLQAIRMIVQETMRTQAPSGQAPYQAPAPSPQGYAPAQAPVYQAPVTPVMIVRDKSLFHRGMAKLGAKMALMGQPTVTQGVIQQSVTPVAFVATPGTTFPVQSPAPQTLFPVSYQQAPVSLATPQAPHK